MVNKTLSYFRAKLEEEYSKGLSKLVKNAGGSMEIG